MKKIKDLLVIALFFVSAIILGQTTVTGTVLDDTGEPLPGASVVEKGTTNGTTTDFDGKFSLNTKANSGTVVVSFVGFDNSEVAFSGGSLGTIKLSADGNVLEEVVITATGIIDLAEDRKTPIAVSTIKAAEIAAKGGNLDLPEILKETPSIQTAKGGGYGDSNMTLRGFDQSNIAFLLNGQPINGMEDGLMYWSNWQGVMDIANAIQVQRGLGSSKLAISSVGGTVNIVTKTVDKKEGGFIGAMVGNDNYVKTNAYYSTGLMDNGLAISAMAGHWQGDGYRNGTMGQGQTYFLSVGYKVNEKNIINAMITGAPQWHGDAWEASLETYLTSDAGRKFNSIYGTRDGEEYPGARNFYHKPVANLSWDWEINDNSTLSSVAYASWGRGGYAFPGGSLWGYRNEDQDGTLDFDAAIADNISGDGASYVRASMNNHNWYGLLTNYGNEVNDNLSFNIGADFRYYNGDHFRMSTDLLGLEGFDTSSERLGEYTVSETFGGHNPWGAVFNANNDHTQRSERDYQEVITYLGAFGQIEYSQDAFSAFLQGAVSNQSYQLEDFFNYSEITKSDLVNKLGFNVKGGLGYAIAENQKIYANAGYYSRQPYLDNIFVNTRGGVELITPGIDNETVLGFELGYGLDNSNFDMNINLYHTTWGNRTVNSSNTENDVIFTTLMRGVEQTHLGGELDFMYKVTDFAKLGGFVSIGDWQYTKNVTDAFSYNSEDDSDITEEEPFYLEGRKVGGAAQTSFGWNVQLKFVENLNFDISQRFFDRFYSNVGATTDSSNASFWSNENNAGPIRLPSYSLFDTGLTYKLDLNDSNDLTFRLNVNNLTDTFYIEWSDGTARGGDTWKGVNTSNDVEIGFGRTWNFGVRYNF